MLHFALSWTFASQGMSVPEARDNVKEAVL